MSIHGQTLIDLAVTCAVTCTVTCTVTCAVTCTEKCAEIDVAICKDISILKKASLVYKKIDFDA